MIERGLLLLALAARVAWALLADTGLWLDHVFTDATAMGLLEGRGFTCSLAPPFDPAVFRTPGYPAFLALVYGVAGHSVRAAFLVQALLDTASCALLHRLASRRLGPGPARWVLLVAALYPFTVHAVGTLSPETLLLFLGLLLLAVAEGWGPDRSPVRTAAAGVLLGALCWIKPVFLPLPAFLALAEKLRGRPLRTALVRAGAAGLVGAALFAPWVLRNQREFGRPVLAGELGIVVWHGTFDFEPERDRMIREGLDRSAAGGGDREERTRERFTDSRALLARDRELLREGLRRIRERPLRGLLLDPLRRIPRLWISTGHVFGPAWVGTAAAAVCVLFLLAGLLGLLAVRGRLRELAAWWALPLHLTLSYAALHAEARYTLPARPSLLLLVGVFLSLAAARAGRKG